MAKTVYVAGLEPDTGKSVIALAVMEMLARRVDRVGFFRPVVASRPLRSRPPALGGGEGPIKVGQHGAPVRHCQRPHLPVELRFRVEPAFLVHPVGPAAFARGGCSGRAGTQGTRGDRPHHL